MSPWSKNRRCGNLTQVALVLLVMAGLGASRLAAGVVYEIEVMDHEQSPPKSESIEAAVEGKHLKMGIPAASAGGSPGAMIFRGDRREMIVLNTDDKSYVVLDEATIAQIGGQVSQAMAQVQEALKDAPADQRAMIEKMMKGRLPQTQPAEKPPGSELKKTGEKATHGGYPCVKYEVWRGGRKVRELWVAPWSNIEGGKEAAEVFEDMADFFSQMMDSLPDMGGGFGGAGLGDNPFEHMKDLDGFPVVTRELGEDGSLKSESTLRSAQRRTLDPAEFEPPSGYKRQQMFPH